MAIFAIFDRDKSFPIFHENKVIVRIFDLFHQMKLLPIFDEKQGYSMAIFTLVWPK